jgi:hypothetical protein
MNDADDFNFSKRKELEPEDFYIGEHGYKVFTEKYHLKRGYCCKSGCKHCPYGYDKKTDSFSKKKD